MGKSVAKEVKILDLIKEYLSDYLEEVRASLLDEYKAEKKRRLNLIVGLRTDLRIIVDKIIHLMKINRPTLLIISRLSSIR
jgi:hypothetical protein